MVEVLNEIEKKGKEAIPWLHLKLDLTTVILTLILVLVLSDCSTVNGLLFRRKDY